MFAERAYKTRTTFMTVEWLNVVFFSREHGMESRVLFYFSFFFLF